MHLIVNYITLFKSNSFRNILNEKKLIQLFYNSFIEEVNMKLYKESWFKTIDKYITMAIRINDR